MHGTGKQSHVWRHADLGAEESIAEVERGLYAMTSAISSITSKMKQLSRQDPSLSLAKRLEFEGVGPMSTQDGKSRQDVPTIE